MFDNRYTKFFDARPNAIRTFCLRIKQFLTASNIDFPDILKTQSSNIMLYLVHLKKDHTDASVYQQLFMEILDRYRDYIPVYTDGSWDGNTVAFSNTVISMRLPD